MSELEEEIHILNGFKRMLNRKIRDELRGESSNLDSLTAFVELRLQLSDKVSVLKKELNQKQTFSTTSGYKKG
jgi:DNA anti-recombination protein RmuC